MLPHSHQAVLGNVGNRPCPESSCLSLGEVSLGGVKAQDEPAPKATHLALDDVWRPTTLPERCIESQIGLISPRRAPGSTDVIEAEIGVRPPEEQGVQEVVRRIDLQCEREIPAIAQYRHLEELRLGDQRHVIDPLRH